MSNILFLMGNELYIIDSLSVLKTEQFLTSPFWRARMEFWDQTEALFPMDLDQRWTQTQRLLDSTTYWQHPPTLQLPEHAESLSDWSHLPFLWFPC